MSAEHLQYLIAALAMLVLVQTLRLWWRRRRPGWGLRRRARRAATGERRAIELLERAGYAIEQEQPPLSWTVFVDGRPLEVALRADFLVRRAGRRWVAEVKTGQAAPSLTTAATRQQLLEYRVAYGDLVAGVLLVDAEGDRVHEVQFGELDAGPAGAR